MKLMLNMLSLLDENVKLKSFGVSAFLHSQYNEQIISYFIHFVLDKHQFAWKKNTRYTINKKWWISITECQHGGFKQVKKLKRLKCALLKNLRCKCIFNENAISIVVFCVHVNANKALVIKYIWYDCARHKTWP